MNAGDYFTYKELCFPCHHQNKKSQTHSYMICHSNDNMYQFTISIHLIYYFNCRTCPVRGETHLIYRKVMVVFTDTAVISNGIWQLAGQDIDGEGYGDWLVWCCYFSYLLVRRNLSSRYILVMGWMASTLSWTRRRCIKVCEFISSHIHLLYLKKIRRRINYPNDISINGSQSSSF